MRLKIIAGNLGTVLLLGLAAYLLVGKTLRSAFLREIDADVQSSHVLLQRSFRLSALEFVELVAQRSDERVLRDVFAGLDLDSRRTRAFEAAESTAAWLADPARGGRGSPDIAVIVDETGRTLARNGARNVMFAQSLMPQLPALQAALKSGKPVHDVWLQREDDKLLQTAIAPIRSESGAVLGALIVGYELSNGVAKREAALLGHEIAFLAEGKVYSASLEGAVAQTLRGFLFGPHAAATQRVLAGQLAVSPLWSAQLQGNDYSGVISRLPMLPSHPVAVALLANRTQRLAVLAVLDVIPILTVLAALLVFLYGVVIGNSIMRPIERIEEGVLAVINGRSDVRLDTKSPEFGGLAFRINQLLNVMTGTAEPSEDEHGRVSLSPSQRDWKDAEFADSRAARGSAPAPAAEEPIDDPAVSAKLALEEQGSYTRRIYIEYATAKAALGEDVSNLPQDRFEQRLAGRATALLHKHGCRMVRFQVETRDNQVILRPVLIR